MIFGELVMIEIVVCWIVLIVDIDDVDCGIGEICGCGFMVDDGYWMECE